MRSARKRAEQAESGASAERDTASNSGAVAERGVAERAEAGGASEERSKRGARHGKYATYLKTVFLNMCIVK